jgi:hypothetical protein
LGTVTVGATPDDPAGDRSATGMTAIEDPVAVGAPDVVVTDPAATFFGGDEEPQAARASAVPIDTTAIRVRRHVERDMFKRPFEGGVGTVVAS